MNKAFLGWGYRDWTPEPEAPKPVFGSKKAAVLAALPETDGTAVAVAARTGMSLRNVSAVLSYANKVGELKRTKRQRKGEPWAYVYEKAA